MEMPVMCTHINSILVLYVVHGNARYGQYEYTHVLVHTYTLYSISTNITVTRVQVQLCILRLTTN